jgi:dephospho-CoA kinase
MRVVGLTGGIACGKSSVSSVAASLGVRVIDMDEIARRVVAPGLPAHRALVSAFGLKALRADGSLDRAAVGAMAFADRSKRKALNSATHMPILIQLLAELGAALSANEPAVLIDAPLLYETGLHWLCAHVIVVRVSEATQTARLRARDGFTAEEAARRVAAQMPLARKVAKADVIVDNDGDRSALPGRAEAALRAAGCKPGTARPRWGLCRLPLTRSRLIDVALWVVLLLLRFSGVSPLPEASL